MARGTRKKWAERIARWARSGLTANQFATEAKLNAGTLKYYKWLIDRDSRVALTMGRRAKTKVDFVELRAGDLSHTADSVAGDRIEVVLARGTRVLVPNSFDDGTLRRVVDALEAVR
jgi:transposase